MALYAEVILPLSVEGVFTYSVPEEMEDKVQRGCRVVVPFGVRKYYSAVVFRLHNQKPSFATKDVLESLDDRPVVTSSQLDLWQWIADYYICMLGEVYVASMPGGMKLASESVVCLVQDADSTVRLTPAEMQILSLLEKDSEQKVSALQKATGINGVMAVLKRLMDKGQVRIKEELSRTYKPKSVSYVKVSQQYFVEESLDGSSVSGKSQLQKKMLSVYADLSCMRAALAVQNMGILKEVTRQRLLEESGLASGILNQLRLKGVLEVYEKPVDRISGGQLPQELVSPVLSAAQRQTYADIMRQWESHNVCLLHGVTGSGKTEIYIQLIKDAVEQGKQVLYLLPEIVLTAQLTERLRKVFGGRLGVYHSRYSDAERIEVYMKMLSSSPYDIIVGVRSSVFLPFVRLGLVIVDEEHETSFKQEDPAPRYHARNTAIVLAAKSGAHVLLGSATPSVESYYNAERGKYGLVTLSCRYGDVQLPEIEIVDIHESRRKRMMSGPFSPQMLSRLRYALEHRQQAIVFQNLRGYAPVMECQECGWTPRCQRCDVSLTVHRYSGLLTCHYCGSSYSIPAECPNCGNRNLFSKGYGTERIEDELQRLLPEAKIARMDLDTTRSRMAYERILHDFQTGATDILVGTQMVSKGLDFDHVSTVCVFNASAMLHQPHFRSYERTFQMLEQVAGRAGRRGKQGHVVLQTYDPQEPVIQQVVAHDYVSMYRQQLEERRLFCYPPFCRIIYIYAKHRDENVLNRAVASLAGQLKAIFGDRLLGPDSPPVSRVQYMHIRKFILKLSLSDNLAAVRHALLKVQKDTLTKPDFSSTRIHYDVD